MDNYFALNIKNQIPTRVLQSGRLSLLNWLNGFENKNVIEFDEITNIASDICKTPIALIGLIEGNSFNFNSTFTTASGELQRAASICRQVIQDEEFVEFVEPDELTGDLAFCVGIPLKTSEGKLIGALCVISYNLQTLSETEKNALENLANLTTALYEQRSLRLKEEKQFKFLEDHSSAEMYLVSPSTLKVLYANHNALRSLGYPSDIFLSKNVTEILVARDSRDFQRRLFDLAINNGKSFSTFAEQINYDGSKTMVKLFVSFVREGFDSSILIISRNLSHYSSKNSAENRQFFENLVNERVQKAPEQSGLLLIDLENLRLLNTSFGYDAGENVVREFSKILGQFLEEDEVLVRTGQDAFSVLLPNCDTARIKQKAVQIIDLVSNQIFSENNKKFKLQINIGAVLINPEDTRQRDYLSLANKACNIAKEFGENQFYLADKLDPLFIQKTIEMEQLVNVQDAIERNKLLLYGQKIEQISTDAENFEEHYEILIRMLNKDGEVVSPMSFIPQLEKHGSIVSLDKWVLKESLKSIAARHQNMNDAQSEKKFMYNINLSARTIADACFMSYCTELLVKYCHLAPYICFEITETVAISNFETVQEFIQIISRFGCKFALDDFGSGGASFEYLKKLSVDFVKIDGSFVADVLENPISQIIVESICKVANVLKIEVIAEKVESQVVEDALIKYGVHYVQGYKVQPPVPFVRES